MHPWHDVYIDEDQLETVFPVVIEVPMGSKNKYELDKESGLLRLDRVLFSAVHYPANYGFVPRSFCDDGDPLDALVLGQEAVVPLTIMNARAIGVMRIRDDKGIDDKIIAVSVNDPVYQGLKSSRTFPNTSSVKSSASSRTTKRSRTKRWSSKACKSATKRFRFCATGWLCTGSFAAAKSPRAERTPRLLQSCRT